MTPVQTLEEADRDGFLRLVEDRFGLRSSRHQARHLEEAVQALLSPAGCTSPQHLLALFATGRRPDLLEQLVARLTVGETHFFRVAAQVEALRRVILPELTGRRMPQRRLSIWSAGCSTGEEPYTLAILLREALPSIDQWALTFLGTDISKDSIKAAREAIYGDWSFRDTPEAVRQRCFSREGLLWRLTDDVRRMVVFDHWNLTEDTCPSPGVGNAGFDLIVCRNVTIYFSAELTQHVYRRFAQSLAPGGWLMLGPSDGIPEQPTALEATVVPGTMLWRKPIGDGRVVALSPPVPPTPAPLLVRPAATYAGAKPAAGAETWSPLPASPSQNGNTASDIEQLGSLVYSGDRASALAQATRVAAERPLEAEAHLVLGMLHLDDGKTEEAVESLRRATFLDAQHPLAHFTLGRAYLLSGDPSRATAVLTHARRVLAALPDEQAVDGGAGLLVGELRSAVETHLALVSRLGSR